MIKYVLTLSKTKLKERARRKTSPLFVETIKALLKNPAWTKLAKSLSIATRKHLSINLEEIDEQVKEGDTVLVPGKVLSQGELTKKIRLCSFGISKGAKEKLKKTKSQYVTILEEIKSNPKAEGLKVIK